MDYNFLSYFRWKFVNSQIPMARYYLGTYYLVVWEVKKKQN